ILTLASGLWLQLGQQLRALRKTTQPQTATVEPPRGLKVVSKQQQRQLWQQWSLVSLAIVLAAIALLLTSSRNGWVMGFLIMVSFVVQQRWYLCLAAIAGAVFSCLWAAFGTIGQGWFRQWVPSLIWARLNDQRYPNRPVEDLRITQWKFAWSMTQDRPWFGWGLQGFNNQYELHTGFWLGHPHNLFLMLSAETGLPATLVLIGVVGFLLIKTAQNSWQQWLKQQANLTFAYWLAFIICSLSSVLDVTLFDARVNMLNWVVLAVIAGHTYAVQADLPMVSTKSQKLPQ
ncbi:MAG: O-antigen ligase family protein, partial [Cyanobacteria bacterium P01_H01_bin.121]